MRDLLTVIIVLLIIGIVLDGIRRVRAARKERIHMAKSLPEADDFPEPEASTGSEFPSGGARVAGYRHPDDAANLHENLKTSLAAKKTTAGAADADQEPAPVLMEPTRDPLEPTLGSLDIDELEDDDLAVAAPPRVTASKTTEANAAKTVTKAAKKIEAKTTAVRQTAAQREPTPEPMAPEEVIVINVMAQEGYVFAGADLWEVLTQQNLRYGSMDIFHRHKNEDGSGEILFSLANIVKPGTFDLNDMQAFTTPGISMFMTLPIQGDSVAAFGLMARTAKAIAEGLQGELKDEHRSVMTQQTFEHCRQRVIEFERKRRLSR